MAKVSITQPPENLSVTANVLFLVTGTATGNPGGPEPDMVASVTVQIDGGTPGQAALSFSLGKTFGSVKFSTWAVIPGGVGPHTITAIARTDQNRTATDSVTVFIGPAFTATPPAVLMDLLLPIPVDPTSAEVVHLVGEVQGVLSTIAGKLSAIGKVLAGPNLIVSQNAAGLDILRIGLWIVDPTTPVVQPVPPYSLPILSPESAQLSFGLVPILNVTPLEGISIGFAVSVPTSTLQTIVDATFPSLQASANSSGAVLYSATVVTQPPNMVTVSISGQHELVTFTTSIIETIDARPLPAPNSQQKVPTVIARNNSTGGSVWEWIVGILNPFFGIDLAATLFKVADNTSKDSGLMATLISAVPSRIPFPNDAFSLPLPPFPVWLPNWVEFDVDNNGIFGKGLASLGARDNTTASATVSGVGSITGLAIDLSAGFTEPYSFQLTDILPDGGNVTWTVTGKNTYETGADSVGFLESSGSFLAFFRLPASSSPGEYPFVVTVSAIETCATDPTQKLTVTGGFTVEMIAQKAPPHMQ